MNSASTYHGIDLHYGCDASALQRELRQRWCELSLDEETREFVDAAPRRRHGLLLSAVHRGLRPFFSDFDINGWLGTYPLFLLSTEQWRHLLGETPALTALDIGAASGDVTQRFAPLFSDVLATETSRPMARRLRRRGLRCEVMDASQASVPGGPYDVVFCLNVIDRCDRPRSLLRSALGAVRPGGRLVVAAPLPLAPFVYAGGATRAPAEPIVADGPNWETCVGRLWRNVFAPLGGELISLTRAPYLSMGDSRSAIYVLDDAVWVIRRPAGPARLDDAPQTL